ncbi:MAG: SDR family oxidoreductase [Betaproteobacteria bacterium]|nr:SDR family oxidoreductase [Betaproteobacteria bacterium]
MRNTALVIGASGIIGSRLAAHFSQRNDWNLIVASRRPPPASERVRSVAVDLLDPNDCDSKLGALTDVTHVFYAALQDMKDKAAEVAPNLAMLTHAVNTLDRVAPNLKTIQIMQGGKAYGAFLGPYKTPAKESDPRHMPPNFYFDQEDFLKDRQAGKRWNWVALRPGIVGGISFGNPMNLAAVIAVYAVISRELGLPLRFPGTPEGYAALHQATDADLLAKAAEWTATRPECANQIYNVTNGDYYRWEHLWPLFADDFGMKLAAPQTIRLTEFMPDKTRLWEKMVAKYGLSVPDYTRVASWGFGDAAFMRHWDSVSNVNKLRATGFQDWVDSEAMYLRIFRQMRELRIIPH